METYTETKIININSKDAIQNNGTFLSSVNFIMNGLLQDNDDIRERYISIQNAQIPFSFYNINIYNNILVMIVNSITYTLTLTKGNYNATTLIQEITTQLTNNSITDITLTISSITGILTFTKTTGSFSIISNGSTIFNVLGFVIGNNYNSVSQILKAPYPLNLLGTLRLRICSYVISTNNSDYSLITIPIETGNFGLIQYTNYTNYLLKLNNVSLDGFDIQIIDDNNNLINFNNINWTMSILLNIVRTKPTYNNLKFQDIVQNNQQITQTDENNIDENLNTDNENINENQNEDIQQEQEQEYFEEPITDDLDLLLYNNHGSIY